MTTTHKIRIERLLTKDEVVTALVEYYGFDNVNVADRMIVDQGVEVLLGDGTNTLTDDDTSVYLFGYTQISESDLESGE